MGKNNPFAGLLTVLVISILLVIMFPALFVILLLAVVAGGLYLWFRFRSVKKQMERELNEQPQAAWQDDLFREQASRLKRTEDAEVIDVEFTRKDEDEEKRQSI